jgi:hypothetical protein
MMIKTSITKAFWIRRAGVFFVLLISLCNQSYSQDYFGSEADKVFQNIYQFKMLSADSMVKEQSPLMSDSALWNLLSAHVAWMEILAGNLDGDYWNKQFSTRIKKAKSNLKKAGVEGDDKLFKYIIVHAFKTRHELLNDNYLNAATDLNTCIDQISESFGREKDHEPFFLTSGLYYYFMAKAYDDYILMRPYLMFYPDGDREKGLKYLNSLTNSDNIFLENESNYFLMRIYYDLEEEYSLALKYAVHLVTANPTNLIYQLYHIKILREIDSVKSKFEETKYLKLIQDSKQLSKDQRDHFVRELSSEK